MTIRDRGKIKWQGAFFMPEHVKMLGNMRTDYYRTKKPQLDTYQFEEFDGLINEAMANNLLVKIMIWQEGFTSEICGRVSNVDLFNQQLRIELRTGHFERVKMMDIISMVVND
jgi:hypothetical protein